MEDTILTPILNQLFLSTFQLLLDSLKPLLQILIFFGEFLIKPFHMIIIGRIDIQVQVESLPQTFALLRSLALEVVGEFARLFYQRGDFFLQRLDDFVLAIKNVH